MPAALKVIRSPLLTCWPVVTEAAWLLRDEPGGFKALAGMIDSGPIQLGALDETACPGSSPSSTAMPLPSRTWPTLP